MVVAMISGNTLQFSQLSFESFGYLLRAGLFCLKIIKNYYKSPLKVCELKV